jgi:hypothetical protein
MFCTCIFLRNEDCKGESSYIQEKTVHDIKSGNPQKVTWVGIPVPLFYTFLCTWKFKEGN